jgi:acetaldehyde dehydrogenase/alcohol dehydrogenase
MLRRVTELLSQQGIASESFSDVKPDPDLETVERGLAAMRAYKPDVVIALGGGSPIDAAKVMWLLYEQPQTRFEDIATRFLDIRKRVSRLAEGERKALFVAIPTTSGTGSEVTPFAVITDQSKGTKYPLADYALTPDIAIVDPELAMTMPKGLTAASGIDAVTHAIEAIASVMASEYTDAMALESLRLLFEHLPSAYEKGAADPVAREKVHTAATLAGMAFANGFLGVCHSIAHKLGGAFHIPHGVANAIMLPSVIRFNASEAPTKQTAFSQYTHPMAQARYARIATALGLGGDNDAAKTENLALAVEKLRERIGVPGRLRDAGVDEITLRAQVDELSERAFDDQCTGCNPRVPLMSEIRELILGCY